MSTPAHQPTTPPPADPAAAVEALDAHLREVIAWHFGDDTGCPYWLNWKRETGFDPIAEVKCFADVMKFPHFDDEALRREPNEAWVPRPYRGKPFKVFETGGTTGMPKQRISWNDHLDDYSVFADRLDDAFFPTGGHWLMLGPTGPRRLRLTIEHVANRRGGSCYFLDLDPRFVKREIADGHPDVARRYQQHVIDQAATLIRHRKISCLFCTPRLLEGLGERIDVAASGITGVFIGGTHMTPQVIRFLHEEVLAGKAQLVPTYGNTLMGLAVAKPVTPDDDYALTYYAPQPRAVLRVVDPDSPQRTVDYGQWGRVELTTLTKEFFVPRFLERDEAVRRQPHPMYPWDGTGDVRPFQFESSKTIEGVY